MKFSLCNGVIYKFQDGMIVLYLNGNGIYVDVLVVNFFEFFVFMVMCWLKVLEFVKNFGYIFVDWLLFYQFFIWVYGDWKVLYF